MLAFLLADDSHFAIDPEDVERLRTVEAIKIVRDAQNALSALGTWDSAAIDGALRGALITGLGLKPRVAFAPVRIAVTGRRVSPPLFESIELLGRDRTLARLTAALGLPPA